MNSFAYDLAISAVSSDSMLVSELSLELSSRLRTPTAWQGHTDTMDGSESAPLNAECSRIALVLYHHLWEHDGGTRGDAALLRERLRDRPGSVCVMTFDDTRLPSWLAKAPRYDVVSSGRAGAADFALEAIHASGGSLIGAPPAIEPPPVPLPHWREGGAPFLSQPRAYSALRHQLDALGTELKPMLEQCRADEPECTFDLQVLPHRVVVQMGDVAVSFSWVAGRLPTVGDGRLLVIAWTGATTATRGMSALKSATPIHERVYVAEGNDSAQWRWRVDDVSSRAYSTANLAAEWVARASIARHAGAV